MNLYNIVYIVLFSTWYFHCTVWCYSGPLCVLVLGTVHINNSNNNNNNNNDDDDDDDDDDDIASAAV